MVLAVLVNYKGRYHPPSIRARSVGPAGSRTGPNPLLKILLIIMNFFRTFTAFIVKDFS